ncbi:Magnesium/proton exchanger [Striga hermonthica]|uniref:Magnesium/proton exchanger n=1 Tax=Striga hermonthica TaxID=68872 RepID=A0A9N7NQ42_STRHE|nr:Magnesium/proton exchanger [Striga hermonthica]
MRLFCTMALRRNRPLLAIYGMLLTHAYAQDKRWPYVSLPLKRGERPEDWVPAETGKSIRDMYSKLIEIDPDRSRDIVDIFSIHSGNAEQSREDSAAQEVDLPSIWEQQFINALTTTLAFVLPYQIAHGWIAFVFSLAFIVTKLTDLISCVTGHEQSTHICGTRMILLHFLMLLYRGQRGKEDEDISLNIFLCCRGDVWMG